MSSPLPSSPMNHEDISALSASSMAGTASAAPASTLEPQVQVDMSHIVGRIKEAPVCVDAGLKKEAMSAEELSKMAFITAGISNNVSSVATSSTGVAMHYEPSVVSSGSSTASRESLDLSDIEGHSAGCLSKTATKALLSSWCLTARKEESDRINHKMTTQKISRNGRQTQRWHTDPATQRFYRLTTGCVPIVEGGKILFASASRKPEWILPKGGWETDEAIEESAIRETFEEAGVLGILGPPLGEVEYETRKAKKRRLDFEEVQRKVKKVCDTVSPSAKSEEGQAAIVAASSPSSNEVKSHDGDACSVASDHSQNYTHVKMKLFPLYVTDVRDSWPEEGRFRKAVHILSLIHI